MKRKAVYIDAAEELMMGLTEDAVGDAFHRRKIYDHACFTSDRHFVTQIRVRPQITDCNSFIVLRA